MKRKCKPSTMEVAANPEESTATLDLLKRQRCFKPDIPASLCSSNHVGVLKITGRSYGSRQNSVNDTQGEHDRRTESAVQGQACSSSDYVRCDWEVDAQEALQKYFGHRKLKGFQRESLEAWAAKQDCFIVAATGSGKSLCFQLPALMTGKVVVVISPLISLMHDQCLQLERHGISACFLGSGQADPLVERKAMEGMYNIVYLCPETLLRLVGHLQELARSHGITLFAIDEAHCVSKWGHDFRPEYRKLSVLRTQFQAEILGLREQVPIMALTATATVRVRDDILQALGIEKRRTKLVLTTLFRPNLKFSVHHSKTTRPMSYQEDFNDLVRYYIQENRCHQDGFVNLPVATEQRLWSEESGTDGEEDTVDGDELDVQYLEEDESEEGREGDFGVSFDDGGMYPPRVETISSKTKTSYGGPHDGNGPTIVYMPTRKETVRLAKYLSRRGVVAAPYHAKLPKTHLRQVHKEFQDGVLQVVVATIAFGMGINKSNVRNVIHYGWPQSLEAYYQEAGRAGRDGLLSHCRLFCDMTVLPSLLPSRRDAQQAMHALQMLFECFIYGIRTTVCRVKMLLSYFSEELPNGRCNLCDVCTNGPPPVEDLTGEAAMLLSVLNESLEQIPFKFAVDKVITKENLLITRDRVWWRGFGQLLLNLGYVKESDGIVNAARNKMSVPTIQVAELTLLGMQFLSNCKDFATGTKSSLGRESTGNSPPLLVYPQGDMIHATKEPRQVTSRSSERGRGWGRGWADPAIRAQRLASFRTKKSRKPRKKEQIKSSSSVRGRPSAKLKK